jgi:ATP-dependent helicase/nuclease subunit A
MNAGRTIPHNIRSVQVQAADPEISAFVSANAGSGKTHVLAQRVINQLLRGCDPTKILCITFTKAAAANMANRVLSTLAEWTGLDDAALDEKIALSIGRKPNIGERTRARRLFASALETPGGLKVHTIHAFCTRLLHQFPFEANVTAGFSVLDEATTEQLLNQLIMSVLLEASAKPESRLGRALSVAVVEATDQTFREVIGDTIRARNALIRWITDAGSIEAAMAEVSQILGIDISETQASIEDEYFSKSLIPDTEWPTLIEILASGSANDKKHAGYLEATRLASGRARIDHYLRLFCTSELETRKTLLTKTLADRYPDWLVRLLAEQKRVYAIIDRERALHARERTSALITIAQEVITRYQHTKERRALLDYDDLIEKTLELFTRSSAAWVLYKLDLGIDHILIDEAQDTSPRQWDIIRAICSEFIPGSSRSETKRTVFAVGDEKQSIFSFQGAAPKTFDEMRRLFERQFGVFEQGWRYLRFHHSFRSGPNVLASVDKVFSGRDIFASITADETGISPHQSLPDAAPGLVELWPLIAPSDKREIEGWDAPFDTQSEESPRVKLAHKIATHVKFQITKGLKASDILILVRQRGPLFEAIIRALKNAHVPVAGADRLMLTEHIAVMDLMALADCLLLPDDDLALASVLKSPLFGFSEEQLFKLAWNRQGSLRSILHAKGSHDPLFAETARALIQLTQVARKTDPFTFFARVLGSLRGRQKFLERLGPEVNDALDEFLNLALEYEKRQTPSLQGFLAWLHATKSEVKRDMEMARDEVRVMTVHGAKGLEANTIILADTTTPSTGPRDPYLLKLPNGAFVWATTSTEDMDVMKEAREAARRETRDEYRRLLYVAMTRAAERLIICGAQNRNHIPNGCWYQLIRDALMDDCVPEPADDNEGEVLRYRKHAAEPVKILPSIEKEAARQKTIPAWLSRNVATDKSRMRIITPSNIEEDIRRPTTSVRVGNTRKRGLILHRLMQSLPELPPERRIPATRDFLTHAAQDLGADDCEKITAQVACLLSDNRFQALYAPGSRAEVDIVGRLQLGGRKIGVSGRIDRLAVTQKEVLIADFKTNRLPPDRIDEVPRIYVRQLALYRAVLGHLYPDRRVRAALIWTEVPELTELSPEILDTALDEICFA